MKPTVNSERHREVLEAGLSLVSERGVAGASLRELARRVGMSQPSLYHYFKTKEELIAQLVDYCSDQMILAAPNLRPPPSDPVQLPRYLADVVVSLYCQPRHPRFVRMLWVLAIEEPKMRQFVEQVFGERMRVASKIAAAPLIACGWAEREAESIVNMVVYSIGFPLMEETVLYGHEKIAPHVMKYVDDVVMCCEQLIAFRTGERPANLDNVVQVATQAMLDLVSHSVNKESIPSESASNNRKSTQGTAKKKRTSQRKKNSP